MTRAFEMTYKELRETLENASCGTMQGWIDIHPLLTELYGNAEKVPVGRPNYIILSTKHRESILRAKNAGRQIPEKVLQDYPELSSA